MSAVSDPVKKKRAYTSPTRRAKAARTRARILAAASEKFLAHGYVQTSTASIARAAGTSEANVFAVFGSKAELLFQVTVHHIRNAPDFPMGDLTRWQGLVGADRRDAAAARMAEVVRDVMDRSWRIRAVVAAASSADDAAREIAKRGANTRHDGVLWFAREVLELPEGQREPAADVIWTLINVNNYRLLVLDRGWSSEQYQRWLESMLMAALP